jgi:hypothetical protein
VSERGAIAIFVKTIGYSPVKTRLAAAIGPERATEFYRLCLAATRATVQHACSLCSLEPYWAVAEADAVHDQTWSSFATISQGDGTLGDRLLRVYSNLLDSHPFVMLIGADAPLLSAGVIVTAADVMTSPSESEFAISRSGDGGYCLFAGRVAIPSYVWQAVPYSSSRTADAFVSQLQQLGNVAELRGVDDIDTVADLPSLLRDAADAPLLPEQAAVVGYAHHLLTRTSGLS